MCAASPVSRIRPAIRRRPTTAFICHLPTERTSTSRSSTPTPSLTHCAQRSGVKIAVAFVRRYRPAFIRARDLFMKGSIGKPVLCLAGIAGGIVLSYGVSAAFKAGFPTLSILITPGWMVRAGFIAMAGTPIGASYPAWVASRKDAVEALTFD